VKQAILLTVGWLAWKLQPDEANEFLRANDLFPGSQRKC
jgi:hypothetical protein